MRFVDEAIIEVAAGDGGNGCASFLRLRFQARGGPNGGDGGKGGDVILRASTRMATLSDHSYLRHFRAGRGAHGQGSDKNGRAGEDKIVEVPVGTQVRDMESGELVADLTTPDQEVVVARGGRGGRGNRHFATSTNRAPRRADPGGSGQQCTLRLELKLLAEVGLIGLPNAGKSSLIRALSQARPKVADYPFTTLTPSLGVVHGSEGEPFTVADIPGLVEGAHQGAGLGLRFLRHVERTRLFVFVVDLSNPSPADDLATIQAELAAYDPALASRAGLVAANKLDLDPQGEALALLQESLGDQGPPVLGVSAQSGQGLDILLESMTAWLRAKGQGEEEEPDEGQPDS